MDQALRPNHIEGEYGPASGSKIARQLARVGAGLGTLVLMVLAWHLLLADAAAVNLRAAAKAQSVVAVASTKRMRTPANTADTRSRGPWREQFSEAGLVSWKR
jgi:hypothetical protein